MNLWLLWLLWQPYLREGYAQIGFETVNVSGILSGWHSWKGVNKSKSKKNKISELEVRV